MSTWQPIETIPKEPDTWVLLCWSYKGHEVNIIRIGKYFGEYPNVMVKCELDFGDFSASGYSDKEDSPTHWMPLPEPPKE